MSTEEQDSKKSDSLELHWESGRWVVEGRPTREALTNELDILLEDLHNYTEIDKMYAILRLRALWDALKPMIGE